MGIGFRVIVRRKKKMERLKVGRLSRENIVVVDCSGWEGVWEQGMQREGRKKMRSLKVGRLVGRTVGRIK